MSKAKTNSEATIRVLEKKRLSLFSIIQKCYEMSTKVDKDPSIMQLFIEKTATIDETKDCFIKVIESINMEHALADPDYDPDFSSLETLNDIFTKIKSKMNMLKDRDVKLRVGALSGTTVPKIELPPLKIPIFSGDINTWNIFYENFRTLIHENIHLANSQKVQYLVGHLSQRALTVISGITPSGDNYDLIWNTLLSKYQDKRQIAANYLEQIIQFKPLTQATCSALDMFIERFCSSVAALKQLDIQDLSDYVITHIALSKLDLETVKLFEQQNKTPLPTFDNLHEFIINHSKLLSRSNLYKKPIINNINKPSYSNKQKQYIPQSLLISNNVRKDNIRDNTQINSNCPICNGSRHPLFKCNVFMQMNNIERFNAAKNYKYCTNCLGYHKTSKCESKLSCLICNKKHHTAIHLNNTNQNDKQLFPSPVQNSHPTSDSNSSAVCTNTNLISSNIERNHTNDLPAIAILPTAVVNVRDTFGNQHSVRILLDSGSMSNFITTKCANKLGLHITRVQSSVTGIGGISRDVKGVTQFQFNSIIHSNDIYTVDAFVLERITSKLPTVNLSTSLVNKCRDFQLADINFHVPGDIDCLMGINIFNQVIGTDKICIEPGKISAIHTSLGYVIMGSGTIDYSQINNSLCSISEYPPLELTLKKFWELENIPNATHTSIEDKKCEYIFCSTHTRDSTGRYTIHLPFSMNPELSLGDSLFTARRRFIKLENKLQNNPVLKEGYNAVIREYLNKDYLVLSNESVNNYYLPHNAVVRDDKITSKIRITVDGGSKSSSGKSLNDILYTGSNLQTNIFSLLLELRLYPVAMTADIEKMFFQVMVAKEHQKYQSILFRFDPQEPLLTYQFKRISFGLTCSPYLAMRTIQKLVEEESSNFPLASQYIPRNLYMDDYLGSVENISIAKQLIKELIGLFQAGGFNLTKWLTNIPELNNFIPEPLRAQKDISFDDESHTKVVGLMWKPLEDYFYFHSRLEDLTSEVCTKRIILSTTARYYDPLGLISPMVTYLKLLVQDCWKAGLDWDEPATGAIQRCWNDFISSARFLNSLKIPRHIGIHTGAYINLLGFADSSEKCYGASVYVAVSTDPDTEGISSLFCSKSKLAPLSNKSLPRLELCACVLLAKLMKSVVDTISARCNINEINLFTDSTVTLSWIHSPSYRWQTFVANRVAAIQELFPAKFWRHVTSEDNPSDVISRPLTAKGLLKNQLWFRGPSWASLPTSQWPCKPFSCKNHESPPEEKATVFHCNAVNYDLHPYSILSGRISSYNKLLRSVVYVLRFIKKLNSRKHINNLDLESAENSIIHYLQIKHFSEDYLLIKNNKQSTNKLIKLKPFMDNNILRVGGRLSNANLLHFQKHPAILPQKDPIVDLIIRHFHIKNLHTGPTLLMSLLRQKFWILSARSVVRKITQSCNVCFKFKPRHTEPLMGEEPTYRVQEQIKPFWHTGVDYAGPINITPRKGRGITSHKAYISLFICLTTKAIHIELVNDLSSDSFISALKRFISRRGPISVIHTDGATNFLGAKNQLNELYSVITSSEYESKLNGVTLEDRIIFKTMPPLSPHMSGVWESQIKCVKTHLIKVIGAQVLTYEEMLTVLVQIEALLNSRPLFVQSSDPTEPTALTPAHFLHNVTLSHLPARDLSSIPNGMLARRELTDKLVRSYWDRWRTEYLSTLQTREKWNTPSKPILLGSIVLIREDNVPPLRWPLGTVEELHPGRDGIVRVITVRTGSGCYKRPVVRICPLPTQ